jgi:restriction endonuclease S subunit
MGISQYKLTLAEISHIKSLRVNESFYDKNELGNSQVEQLRKKYKLIRLAEVTHNVTQGLQVHLEDSDPQGETGILSIENIDDNSTFILPSKGFLPITPKKGLLQAGFLVTPRVRDIGNVGQIRDNEKFVSTENVLNIELSDKMLTHYSLKAEFIAFYLSLVGKNQLRLLRTGGEAGNINYWLLQEILIPVLPIQQQNQLISKIQNIFESIDEKRKTILTLQSIIDEQFVKHGIKANQPITPMTCFSSDLVKVGYERQLRFGALYRWFWDVNYGKLFDSNCNYESVDLSSLIMQVSKANARKGILSEDYYLIELDDIESLTGRIMTKRLVNEVNSDKTIFGDCDFLTSKLRPYLGYTILNDKTKPLIGTSELLPFKVKGKNIPEFVKYMLLSKDYLTKSKYLMYGKEHPRISGYDILRIKVPNVPESLQKVVVAEIQEKETINNVRRDAIKNLKEKAETVMLETLGLKL